MKRNHFSTLGLSLLFIFISGPLLFGGGNREQNGAGGTSPEDGAKPVIFASIIPARFLVEEIGGERVIAETVVLPGESPATYEPGPRQMGRISTSPLLFRIGVPFENGFIPKLQDLAPDLQIVDLRQNLEIRILDAPHSHEEDEKHADDDHEDSADQDHPAGSPDPHIWMSPRNMMVMAETVQQALTSLDPAGESWYRQRTAALVKALREVDLELSEALASARGKQFFVYHPAFGYLADAYGLKQVPLEIEGKEPTARQLTQYIEEAKEEGVRIIFVQPEFPRESAKTVAAEIGGTVVPINSLSPDYIDNLRKVASLLQEGLQ